MKRRIAVCQTLCIDSDREGNLRRIQYAVEEAVRQRAALACFPETAILGWVNPEAHRLADPIPGATYDRIAMLARRHRIMIALGIEEKDGDKLYDSAVLIDSDGSLLLKHRKINNLPRLMKPPYAKGNAKEIAVVETRIGRVGLLICADTFVESLVRGIGEQSPELLIVPYGWAAKNKEWPSHGKNLEKVVSQAARWAGCPVVGTDLVGAITHGPWAGQTYGGQSVVVDRRGKTLVVLRDRDVDVRIIEVPVGRGLNPQAAKAPRKKRN